MKYILSLGALLRILACIMVLLVFVLRPDGEPVEIFVMYESEKYVPLNAPEYWNHIAKELPLILYFLFSSFVMLWLARLPSGKKQFYFKHHPSRWIFLAIEVFLLVLLLPQFIFEMGSISDSASVSHGVGQWNLNKTIGWGWDNYSYFTDNLSPLHFLVLSIPGVLFLTALIAGMVKKKKVIQPLLSSES